MKQAYDSPSRGHLAFVAPAVAQQRQPAQITTLPTTAPQEFDILDSTGQWARMGTAANGVLNEVWSDSFLSQQAGRTADR